MWDPLSYFGEHIVHLQETGWLPGAGWAVGFGSYLEGELGSWAAFGSAHP